MLITDGNNLKKCKNHLVKTDLAGVLSHHLYHVRHGKVHDVVPPRQLQDHIGPQQVVALEQTRGKTLVVLVVEEPRYQVLGDLDVPRLGRIQHRVLHSSHDNSTQNWKKTSNSAQNNFGKITEKELDMTLRNIELLSSSVSFSFTSRHFPAFLKCYKMGKPSKSKFALNSFFTILALARFFLSTVELFSESSIYPNTEFRCSQLHLFSL